MPKSQKAGPSKPAGSHDVTEETGATGAVNFVNTDSVKVSHVVGDNGTDLATALLQLNSTLGSLHQSVTTGFTDLKASLANSSY